MGALERLQASVPINSRGELFAHAVALSAAYMPHFGVVPRAFAELGAANLLPYQLASKGPIILGGTLGLFYGAKALELLKPAVPKGIWIGDSFIAENAFWTSILCTGRPSAGKTSGLLMPVAEQIFRLYRGPDYIESWGKQKENPYAKIGGLVEEVKGEFYEMVAYLMDRDDIGRNVYEDCLIIRPDSQIPLAQFKDEHGNLLYVNALPCSSGSDAGRLLMAAQRKKGIKRADLLPEDIFTRQPAVYNEAVQILKVLEYPVDDPEICFVGWRREENRLVRVSHTAEYRKPAYLLDEHGQKQYIPVPTKLHFQDIVPVSNGLIYNLIDNNVGANEAAEKLTKMAAMAGRGEAAGKDNKNVFWTAAAQRLLANCIQLRRAIAPSEPVHCGHVAPLVSDDTALAESKKELNKQLTSLRAEYQRTSDPDLQHALQMRQIRPLELLFTYFDKEWPAVDMKIKTTIKQMVGNTFSTFISDSALFQTFCQKPTFSMAESIQNGVVFCYVPGPQYKNLAKVIGTGFKLDWQEAALSRIDRPDFNKQRPLIQLTDECWNWVISGGSGTGDPYFLSMCRQARVLNLLATQNYSQFVEEIGTHATDNYLGQFGVFVWLQTMNKVTNQFAEDLMAKVKRQVTKGHESDGAAKTTQEWEEKRLFSAQDFVQLGLDEAIVFDAYKKHDQAIKTKLPKSQLTHPDEKPKIERFMRQFLAGSVEQALWKQNRAARLDPKPVGKPAPTSPPPATPPIAPTKPALPSALPPPQPAMPSGLPPAKPIAPPNVSAPTKPAQPAPTPGPAAAAPPPNAGASAPPGPPASSQPTTPAAPADIPPPPPIGAGRKLSFQATAGQRIKPEAGARAGGAAPVPTPTALTPARVDADAEEFQKAWNLLALAAADVTADDEYGIGRWIKTLAQKARGGEPTSHLLTTGPNGISVGDDRIQPRASPLTPPPPELLEARERAARDAKLLHSQEERYQQKPGILPTAFNDQA